MMPVPPLSRFNPRISNLLQKKKSDSVFANDDPSTDSSSLPISQRVKFHQYAGSCANLYFAPDDPDLKSSLEGGGPRTGGGCRSL
ncbi:MAG TPA: hypothetical protein ENN47_12690 [Mesotoga infera]|uniref:Uncharacterized protein n=1 Tax=Mesotoga infera TaxID=1236046 RepID=A0A7C1H5G2_9BACT|nr:hypothetical protein [Mesotoga infera]